MKLKTLKDIKTFLADDDPYISTFRNQIKAEVIKWVKYYSDEENSFPIAYRKGALEVLEVFFNITEEDLK